MTPDEGKNPTLRQLLAPPVALVVGGLTLSIAPMGWHRGCIAVEHLLPAVAQLPVFADPQASREERFAQWAGVAITYREEIAAFCAEASALPLEEIKALPPTAVLELVVGLVEINLDFFAHSLPGLALRVRGRLAVLSEKLQAATASTTSSSAS